MIDLQTLSCKDVMVEHLYLGTKLVELHNQFEFHFTIDSHMLYCTDVMIEHLSKSLSQFFGPEFGQFEG